MLGRDTTYMGDLDGSHHPHSAAQEPAGQRAPSLHDGQRHGPRRLWGPELPVQQSLFGDSERSLAPV